MMTDDLENELRNLKLMHLTESELAAYDDQQLDHIGRIRAEAHLKQCFICEQQLEMLREENAALANRVRTDEDLDFVERMMEQTRLEQQPSAHTSAEVAREGEWRERLSDYLQQMVAGWLIAFRAVRHGSQGKEVWRWQSKDGRLRVRATIEENADMIVHFSSNDMQLDGARFRFRLGPLNQEVTLERISESESEVAAQVVIPWSYRHMMSDISIEPV